MTSHASALVSALSGLRRRWRIVTFTVHASVLAAAVLTVVVPVLAWRQPDTAAAAALVVSGTLAALAAAALLTWLRTPKLRRAAADADRTLALDDRLVTALQHSGEDDVVSLLLVADAARRTRDLDARQVYPLRWPRGAMHAISAAAVLVVVATPIARRASPASAQATTAAAAPAQPTPGAADDTAGAGATRDAAANEQTAIAAPIANTPPADRSLEASDRAARAELAASGGNPAPAATAAESGLDAAGNLRGAGTARGVPGSLQGGGTAAAPSSIRTSRAGGVGRGDMPADGAARIDEPRAAANRVAYASARARAEAAIARERMPAGMRDYLKTYFIAIRP